MSEVITEMVLPGVYIEVRSEGLIGVGGIVTGRIGIVGTAAKGPLDEVVTLSSYAQTRNIFGDYDAWKGDGSELTLVRALEQAFNNGATDVRAVRVGGSSTSRANAVLQDTNGNDQIRIQAKDPGKWANNGTVKVEMNVEQKVKTFKVPAANGDSKKTAPFSADLTELQLDNTNLVRKDGAQGNLQKDDIIIRNLSNSPVINYELGNSIPTFHNFSVSSAGKEKGLIKFGGAQIKDEVIEVTYYIIKRSVIPNETKNVDENREIELERKPVDSHKMKVTVGSVQYEQGPVASKGIYALNGKKLTFDANVADNALVTVTYRYAPVSLVSMKLLTGEKETCEVENAKDMAALLAKKLEREETAFSCEIISNEENVIKTGEKTLTGGDNGSDAGAAQYMNGFTLLEKEEVNIVLAAGLGAANFASELQSHVESMESQGMDRIGLIGSEAGDDADKIKEHTESVSHRRMILVAPGIKAVDATATREQGRTVVITLPGSYAAAAVAGKLASLAVHISPTNKTLEVRGLEYDFFRAEKKELVQNRVLCLEKKQGYRIIRGISTDSGPFTQITTRRIVDKAKAGIRLGSLPYIGRLNNERVRKALKGTLDGFLNTMVQDEALIGYDLDVTASRDDEINGRAVVTVGLRPTFSIDYIKVIMNLN